MIIELRLKFAAELVETIMNSRMLSSLEESILIIIRLPDGIVIASSYRDDNSPDIILKKETDCDKILPYVLLMLEQDQPFSVQIREGLSLIWSLERD